MEIGLKLDANFDRDPGYRQLYGTADVPGRLRALGVEAVEIPLGVESDHDDIARQVRRCRAAGLRVSFHPYSEGLPANPAHFAGPSSTPVALHARLLAMAAVAAAEQGDTVVNIHPAAVADDGAARRALVDRSVRFFAWARGWCDEHARRVRPVAELQIAPDVGERLIRIGDTPSELAEVVTRSGVGACWDVGHAVSNHRRFGTPADPPAALLGRISHVHCHDVDETDHRPPRPGDAPWRRFLERLRATGYSGTVVIEVTTPTFQAAGGLRAVAEAIETVREAAHAAP
ncbi:MAG TPA: sugar phosphate isomerase/epimerase [Euzebyales bacterium]|nr:sugar phosphate isomerase/epimerase [Euzebyales bacterium]